MRGAPRSTIKHLDAQVFLFIFELKVEDKRNPKNLKVINKMTFFLYC